VSRRWPDAIATRFIRLQMSRVRLHQKKGIRLLMGELAKEILPVNIEDELKQSYLDYAMSVIVGRALPDARDGLKPVHRRVLFAMSELGNDWNKPYKKSARVVGDVIGKYHPHGDTAVYDTIVRMAQPFSLRYLLVDGQGNFGSVDGDNAAAMRYTEVRMTKLAHELLADLHKETVDWVPNYDGTEQIPAVMPTKIPNLLVNGSSGIAVGMATNIPPHNLSEVIDGCLALIGNPELTVDDRCNTSRVRTSRPRASSTAVPVSSKRTAPAVGAFTSVPAPKSKTSTRSAVASRSSSPSCRIS